MTIAVFAFSWNPAIQKAVKPATIKRAP